mgnify:CR=1 FL=1
MSKEELIFCPLGGSGEIGMNMNLYAYGKEDSQKWIIVDMGVTFADDTIPGVDLIMPDPGFIIDKTNVKFSLMIGLSLYATGKFILIFAATRL